MPPYRDEFTNLLTLVSVSVLIYTILVTSFFYWRQYLLVRLLKKRENVSAADFTIMIQDINQRDMKEDYLLSVIKRQAPKTDIQIEKVNYATCRGAQKEAEDTLNNEKKHFDKLRDRVDKCEDPEEKKSLEKILVKAEKHIKKLSSSKLLKEKVLENNSIAFVSLKTSEQASSVKQTSKFKYYIYQWIFQCCCECVFRCIKKKVHWVEPAPEPEDVNWKSPGVSFKRKVISGIKSSIITVASFIVLNVVYSVCLVIDSRVNLAKFKNRKWANIIFPFIWVTPIVIAITNKLLISVAELMVHRETHVTENQRILSLTRKYYRLQLWNTVLGITVGILTQWIKSIYDKDLAKKGIGKTIVTSMLTQMIIGPLLDAYPVGHILFKMIPRWRIERNIKKGGVANVT